MKHSNCYGQLEGMYLLKPQVTKLNVEVDEGRLVCDKPGTLLNRITERKRVRRNESLIVSTKLVT